MTRRLVAASVVITAFIMLTVEVPLGLSYTGRAEDRLLAGLERDARVFAGLVEERIEAGDHAAVIRAARRYASRTDARVVVTDAAGISLVDTAGTDARDFSTRPEIDTALSGAQATGIRTSTTLGREIAYASVPISSGARITGVVRVSTSTDEMRSQIRWNWARLALLLVLMLAAAAAFGSTVAHWAMAPVSQLEAGAQRLAAGDLTNRTRVDRGPPELRRLSATFDEMAARLEMLVGSQRRFVADVSHQLRTPLTVLRLRVESMDAELDAPVDADGLRRDVDAVRGEIERLIRVVEGLLALTRADGSASSATVDVAAAARAARERWDALAEERSVVIGIDAPRSATASEVPGGIDQILDNLLDNAIDVAPEGTAIDITVTARPNEVLVSVRDRGPGLDEEARQRATERFWRGPDAAPGGTGLGLAIVAELARVSGGSMALRDPADGPGLLVEVRLPST